MRTTKSITIVGGGLSGLSLGIGLCRAGVPVEIFEAGEYPRHRVCGEFVAGLSEAVVEKLGIGPVLEGASRGQRMTWFLNEGKARTHNLPEPVLVLSRYTLDARLAQLFRASGGQLWTGERITSPKNELGLIVASGRKPSEEGTRWIGLKLHARHLPLSSHLEFHLGAGGYVGLTQVEDDWVNVCGMFRVRSGLHFSRNEALQAYLSASGLKGLGERLARASIRPGSICAVAGFDFAPQVNGGKALRIGDSCAMVPPFTGNGMAMAFTSAALALDPLVAWSQGDCTWSAATAEIQEVLRKKFDRRLTWASRLHPFLLNPSAQRVFGFALQSGILPMRPLYSLLH